MSPANRYRRKAVQEITAALGTTSSGKDRIHRPEASFQQTHRTIVIAA